MSKKAPSVMFVCLGNICRSPAAEAILRKMEPDWTIESSGIGSWHVGNLPDERMREAALTRGLPLTSRAQQFLLDHYNSFDYILAADFEVLHHLQSHAKTPSEKSKIHLMTAFSELYKNQEVPDPYLCGENAFGNVLDILEESCEGFVKHAKNSACL
jgi:protein-tyrosine phosphatase